jgi:hypothetical protein
MRFHHFSVESKPTDRSKCFLTDAPDLARERARSVSVSVGSNPGRTGEVSRFALWQGAAQLRVWPDRVEGQAIHQFSPPVQPLLKGCLCLFPLHKDNAARVGRQVGQQAG